jgi:hypothetical protein
MTWDRKHSIHVPDVAERSVVTILTPAQLVEQLRTCLKRLAVGQSGGKLSGCATTNYTQPT